MLTTEAFVVPKESALSKLIEKVNQDYFISIDRIQDKTAKGIYLQHICATSAILLDFCLDIPGRYNIFYKNTRQFTEQTIQNIYTWTGVYHFFRLHKLFPYLKELLHKDFFDVFTCPAEDKLYIQHNLENLQVNPPAYEMELIKCVFKIIFPRERLSSPTLAFTQYFFYNSYQNFETYCTNYVPNFG